MKFKTLGSAALLAVVGGTLVLPIATQASTSLDASVSGQQQISKGSVTVEAGKPDPNDKIPDPEDPSKPIDPINPNPNPIDGPMAITNVSDLDFGTIGTSTSAIAKFAAAQAITVDGQAPSTTTPGAADTRGNLVVFSDLRGTNKGYKVTAQMTRPFQLTTDTTKTLNGATISYTNAIYQTTADNMATPGTLSSASFELGYTTDGSGVVTAPEQTVVTAADQQGAGKYVLEFGQSSTYDPALKVLDNTGLPNTDDKSIQLKVPAATASSMTLGAYTADITWTIGMTK